MNSRARPQISWVVLSNTLLPLEHYFYSNLDAVKWQLLTKFCKQNFGKICFFGGKNGGKHENRYSGELKSNFVFVDGELQNSAGKS